MEHDPLLRNQSKTSKFDHLPSKFKSPSKLCSVSPAYRNQPPVKKFIILNKRKPKNEISAKSFESSTLDLRSNNSLKIKAGDISGNDFKSSSRNLIFKKEDRSSFTESTHLGKELCKLTREDSCSKVNTKNYEIVSKNQINQSLSPRTLCKPPKAAKMTKGINKLNLVSHKTCLSAYNTNCVLKEKDGNVDENSTICTDVNSFSQSQIVKPTQISKFGVFSGFKSLGQSANKNTPKNNRYTNDSLLNSQASCDEENLKGEEILIDLEKSDFNNSLIQTINPDCENNIQFSARKHCNSMSRPKVNNESRVDNMITSSYRPNSRMSSGSKSCKAIAICESVERKVKQCRLPVRPQMMHASKPSYSSANKANRGYEVLKNQRNSSECKMSTVKTNMIPKFELIKANKLNSDITPDSPKAMCRSFRNQSAFKETCTLKAKMLNDVIQILQRNRLRRGYVIWKSFSLREGAVLSQSSIINQIQ